MINTIKLKDIIQGAKFKNELGTIFIIDSIENDWVLSSLEGRKKCNYRDFIEDFVLFLNENNCIKL